MGNLSENVKSILDGINAGFNSKTCIGEPIKVGDTTIIPLLELTMGCGVGEFGVDNENKNAGGFGAKASPVAVLVVQNGFTKIINIKNQDAVTKALDMIPDIIDKLTGKDQVPPEVQDAIDSIDEEYLDNI